ncbi:MAG: alpha/beta hydrolase [Myxococcales bacterium]|nr:alpha/beta hydrolase [Myxococcales bacterium]
MIEQVVVMPRWAGTPADDWYPWLEGALAEWSGRVRVLELPDRGAPRIERCVAAIEAAVADAALGSTLLVGHSVGCQAMLRFLAARPAGVAAAGTVCVAGWWSVDAPWPSIVPWIEAPLAFERVRAAAGRVTVVLSDDDPFTADHAANAALWVERLGAAVRLVPGGRHFNGAVEPAVLAALADYGVAGSPTYQSGR